MKAKPRVQLERLGVWGGAAPWGPQGGGGAAGRSEVWEGEALVSGA